MTSPLFCEGMFKTECQDRHFWLSVKSSLLGQKFRFDVEGECGAHTLSGMGAAECGYTMVLDSWGDLVLRASYLACHVHNEVITTISIWKPQFGDS